MAVFIGLSVHASDCTSLIGTCEYYQCVEKTEQCGSKGYYLKFGKHYCEKYKNDQAKYSEKGQEFLIKIRSCLQQGLELEHTNTNKYPKCDDALKFAVGTHKSCYTKYGFCDLPSDDKARIKRTAKKELIHFQMLLFGFWLEKACL